MRVITLLLSNKLAEATSYSVSTVKLTLEKATKAQREIRCMALLFH